jgi:orotate phosphoribosyltransferase
VVNIEAVTPVTLKGVVVSDIASCRMERAAYFRIKGESYGEKNRGKVERQEEMIQLRE